jgi:hypothetical protein
MSRVLFQEKPDFIRYEDEDQILIVAPSEWVLAKKTKGSEEKELLGRYKSQEQAKSALQSIIDEDDREQEETEKA